jgi:glycerate 2-kinase
MPLNVLIVPDKFKGTLTAQAAAEAIACGWKKSRPEDSLELLPMSDGGDGFGEIISRLVDAAPQTVATVDAAHRPVDATWWWSAARKIAIVEAARVVGLAQLPPQKFHPFELDTLGLGAVFQAAAERGATRGLIGLGGSATNDGGFGCARALGWQFDNEREEKPIARWTELWSLKQLLPPKNPPPFAELFAAVDVQNPLLGPTGATRIYGPQKGLTKNDFPLAERCLERLAEVAKREFQRDFAAEPGAGAAGGLGFGLNCFLGARLQPGFQLFSAYADLPERLRSSQLVITAEGAIDQSSLMGKGVGELARLCRERGIPCLGLGGTVAKAVPGERHFTQLRGIVPDLATEYQAKSEPSFWLEQLAARVAKDW